MRELILLAQADSDIQNAFNRYEEYQDGRGKVFLFNLDLALGLIRKNPEMAPIYRGPYRRLLVRDFPFGIFYQVQAKRIVVTAVIDLRKNPKELKRKLGI